MMRILDMDGNEISLSDVDGEKGYLEAEKLLIKHHPQIDGCEKITHYRVKTCKFTDGSSLNIYSEQDPHIKPIDVKNGVFEYINLPDEMPKELVSMDLEVVVDQIGQPTVEAWDEYEYIQRYKLFTDSQLASKKAKEEQEAKVAKFLEEGPARLVELETKMDQILNVLKTIQRKEN